MVNSIILGPDGQPITKADLSEPQTSRTTQLRYEWQGHPSRGLTPSRLASILEAAEQGDLIGQAELFEDMEEKDGHLASEMLKRRGAVKLLEWDIVPPSSPYAAEKAAAKTLKELVAEIPDFEEVVFDITDAIGKGYACLEIEWTQIDGTWLPASVTHRPQSWFTIKRDYREAIQLRDGTPDGQPLQPFGWITHTHRAKSGFLARSSMFRVLAWPYLFKNYSVADLAEFLEIYGIPIRIGKYPPGSSQQDKLTLLRALADVGHNAAGIIPNGMELDFKDAATGDPDAFKAMIDWCERTQSKVILGGTLTSQADGKTSTNALGQVHNEVRKDLRDGDARQIANTLWRDLVYPMAALNGLATGLRRCPRFKFTVDEPEDLAAMAQSLPTLVGMGMRVSRQWAQERVGIPEPESDETDLLTAPTKTAAPITDLVPAQAATTSIRPSSPQDPATRMTDQLARSVSPTLEGWIDQIRSAAQSATSLEALRDQLLALIPDMCLEDYAAAMREGLAAAALAGRYEILREAGSV